MIALTLSGLNLLQYRNVPCIGLLVLFVPVVLLKEIDCEMKSILIIIQINISYYNC
jgi:hypothetical protein